MHGRTMPRVRRKRGEVDVERCEASLVEFALRQFPACKGMMKGLTKVDVARIGGLPPTPDKMVMV